jgi:outer membrane receptor for ferrienterochelin and colicin
VIRRTGSKKDPNPLIIIDGEDQKEKELKDLDPDDIKEINVLKGDIATKKYGDKAKDGVIEITTTKK